MKKDDSRDNKAQTGKLPLTERVAQYQGKSADNATIVTLNLEPIVLSAKFNKAESLDVELEVAEIIVAPRQGEYTLAGLNRFLEEAARSILPEGQLNPFMILEGYDFPRSDREIKLDRMNSMESKCLHPIPEEIIGKWRADEVTGTRFQHCENYLYFGNCEVVETYNAEIAIIPLAMRDLSVKHDLRTEVQNVLSKEGDRSGHPGNEALQPFTIALERNIRLFCLPNIILLDQYTANSRDVRLGKQGMMLGDIPHYREFEAKEKETSPAPPKAKWYQRIFN